jgi:hypothetical protein
MNSYRIGSNCLLEGVRYVRFGSKADISAELTYVSYSPERGHH